MRHGRVWEKYPLAGCNQPTFPSDALLETRLSLLIQWRTFCFRTREKARKEKSHDANSKDIAMITWISVYLGSNPKDREFIWVWAEPESLESMTITRDLKIRGYATIECSNNDAFYHVFRDVVTLQVRRAIKILKNRLLLWGSSRGRWRPAIDKKHLFDPFSWVGMGKDWTN